MPTNRFAHNEDSGAFGVDVEQDGINEAARLSQKNSMLAGTRVEMTIKGQSYLQVGDVVEFNLQTVENKKNSEGAFDPQYSGRYIITKIRHRVTTTEYLNVLELAKDSVASSYRTNHSKTYPVKKRPKDKGIVQDINRYDIFDSHTERNS